MLGQEVASAFTDKCVHMLCINYCIIHHTCFCKYSTYNCNFLMVWFPYTFLSREFWKVPKKQGSSLPVLISLCLSSFPCSFPLPGIEEDQPSSSSHQSRVCGQAPAAPHVCVMLWSPTTSHSSTTAATYQILLSPTVAFHCHQRGECTNVGV